MISDFNLFACLFSRKMPRKPVLLSTIVFMDLETTGLPRNGFKPEITELCLLGVSRFAIEESEKDLRVQNKLTICCHPQRDIQREAASLSGRSSMLILWISGKVNFVNDNSCLLFNLDFLKTRCLWIASSMPKKC